MDTQQSTGIASPTRLAIILSLGAAFVGLFLLMPYTTGYGDTRRSVFTMISRFWQEPDWQHGLFVPFVVGFLVWHLRDRWKGLPLEGSWIGLAGVVLSLFIYWVGYKANVLYFAMIACHGLFASTILWVFGWKWVKALIFPIMFLSFTWPLFFLSETLAFQLRLIMCEFTAVFLNFVGVETLRVGTSVVSASNADAGLAQGDYFSMNIEGACSGLRSLFALIMVSALYGYFALKQPWKRWVLFASSLFFAVLGNFVRLLLLIFGSILWGEEFAIGKDGGMSNYHFLAGIAVFVVALGGMTVLVAILRGREGGPSKKTRATRVTRDSSSMGTASAEA